MAHSWTPRRPGAVTGVAHVDWATAGVVHLVVVGLGGHGQRLVPGGPCFVVPEARARCDEVKDLDDLGPEAAHELAVAAERVLGRDPPLLVRGGSEREVRVPSRPWWVTAQSPAA